MLIDVGIEYTDWVDSTIYNHLILDTSDNSIKYLLLREYIKISNEVVQLSKLNGNKPALDDGVTTKLIMLIDGFELFRNDLLSVYFSYEGGLWYIYFEVLEPDKLMFEDSVEGCNITNSVTFLESSKYACYFCVPALYVEYLVRDTQGRKRELLKILNAIGFSWKDIYGVWHKTMGIDSIEGLDLEHVS